MQRILTKREKIIFSGAIAVVILGVSFNLLYEPVIARVNRLDEEIKDTRNKLKRYVQLLAQKDYIQKKYSKFLIPSSGAEEAPGIFVNTLTMIERIAKDAGVLILDIRPQEISSGARKGTLINLRAEAVMDAYQKFIYNIENSSSLFRIKKLQISVKPNSQTLEADFSIFQFSIE